MDLNNIIEKLRFPENCLGMGVTAFENGTVILHESDYNPIDDMRALGKFLGDSFGFGGIYGDGTIPEYSSSIGLYKTILNTVEGTCCVFVDEKDVERVAQKQEDPSMANKPIIALKKALENRRDDMRDLNVTHSFIVGKEKIK